MAALERNMKDSHILTIVNQAQAEHTRRMTKFAEKCQSEADEYSDMAKTAVIGYQREIERVKSQCEDHVQFQRKLRLQLQFTDAQLQAAMPAPTRIMAGCDHVHGSQL